LDEILEGQTDIFDLLGPHDLEEQPPQNLKKTKQPLADKDPS